MMKKGVDSGIGVLVPVGQKLPNLQKEIDDAVAVKSDGFKTADSVAQLAKNSEFRRPTFRKLWNNTTRLVRSVMTVSITKKRPIFVR